MGGGVQAQQQLRQHAVPRVEQLAWRLVDGRQATGTVLLPPDLRAAAPLFVSYYECPGYLRGSAGDWDWETTASYSRSRSTQEAVAGIYNVERFRAGLLGELCANGDTTCAPGSGGLYYNPFGGQLNNSAQVLDLLREQVPREGESELLSFDARLSPEGAPRDMTTAVHARRCAGVAATDGGPHRGPPLHFPGDACAAIRERRQALQA